MENLTVDEALSYATDNGCTVYDDRKSGDIKTIRVRRGEAHIDAHQIEKGSRFWRVDGRAICTRANAIVFAVDGLKQAKGA